MHPPPTPAVRHRMHTAHAHARAALDLHTAAGPDDDNHVNGRVDAEAWGWCGRSLGMTVIRHNAPHPPLWLRLAATRAGREGDMFWCGSDDARRCLPGSLPRPALLTVHDWIADGWAYRAELYQHTTAPVSRSPVLTDEPDLPESWWRDLRDALDRLAAVRTRRRTTTRRTIASAAERFVGRPLDLNESGWQTAHGDLHWANLCGPRLVMLDWEGWGLGPPGYDLAVLHAYTLLSPYTADTIRGLLQRLHGAAAARNAEIVALTEVLDGYAQMCPLDDLARRHRAAVTQRLGRVTHTGPAGRSRV